MADWGDDDDDAWNAEELSALEKSLSLALVSRQRATADSQPAAPNQAAAAQKPIASTGGLPRNANDLRRCVQHFGLLPPPPLVASQTRSADVDLINGASRMSCLMLLPYRLSVPTRLPAAAQECTVVAVAAHCSSLAGLKTSSFGPALCEAAPTESTLSPGS